MVVEVFVGFIRKQSDMSEYSEGTRDYIIIIIISTCTAH